MVLQREHAEVTVDADGFVTDQTVEESEFLRRSPEGGREERWDMIRVGISGGSHDFYPQEE